MPMPERKSLVARFRRYMSNQSWGRLSTGFTLGSVAGALSGLALLILLPAATALATGAPSWGLGFWQWLVVLIALAVVVTVIDFIGTRIGYIGALGFMAEVHHAVGDQVARLPISWFDAGSAGMLSRMASREMMALSESAAHFIYKLRGNIAGSVVIGIGAWFWDWRLGLLLVVAAPIFALILAGSRRLLDHGKAIQEPAENELAARIVEFARCQGALRACHATSHRQLDEAFAASRRDSLRGLWWEAGANLVSGAFAQIIIVAMIALTTGLVLGGSLGPLQVIVTIGMCLRFTTMLEEIGSQTSGAEERRQMMNHLDAVMDAGLLPEPANSTTQSAPGAVCLDDVCFSYDRSTPVLKDINLEVPAGSMCAVVGPSGSGKTTLARLVARFYDADSGTVGVGGADVRELTTADLMGQLSMVFQDVYLFDDTLEANIRVGNPAATDEQVRRAADLAGVTEIVERLPGGWETRVGEGGRTLSGGERQRVSIARALLKRSPIVLFDEATSALDAENEANIVAAMQELRRNSTLIVIAHKLETIASADLVIVLGADGGVAQRGRHADLVQEPGPYRDFWNYRISARGWSLV